MAQTHAHEDAHNHIVPIRTYFFTLCALMVLMITTVLVADVRLPDFLFISGTIMNQAFALFIAVVKASLVVSIFMGVKWASQLTKFWALLGFAWLSFFTIMAGDYAMRKYEDVQGWEKTKESALPRSEGSTEGPEETEKNSNKLPPPNEINVAPRQ